MNEKAYRINKSEFYSKESEPYVKAAIEVDIPVELLAEVLRIIEQKRKMWHELSPSSSKESEKKVPAHESKTEEELLVENIKAEEEEKDLKKLESKLAEFDGDDIYNYIRSKPNFEYTLREVAERFFGGPIKSKGYAKRIFRAFEGRVRYARRRIEKECGRKYSTKKVYDRERLVTQFTMVGIASLTQKQEVTLTN